MTKHSKTPPKTCQHDKCHNKVICFQLHFTTNLYEGYCEAHAKEHGMCTGCGKKLTPDQLDEFGWCAQCSIHLDPRKTKGRS